MILTLILSFQIYSTGDNNYGRLGQGIKAEDDVNTTGFKKINMQGDVVKFNIGTNHVLTITKAGEVYAWGSNKQHQLLNDADYYWSEPRLLYYFRDRKVKIVDADAGGQHTILLGDDGMVYTFGSNNAGQLGTNKTYIVYTNKDPVKIDMSIYEGCEPVSIAAELYTSYVVCKNGAIYVFGSCEQYKCGDGRLPTESFEIPTLMQVQFRADSVMSGNETVLIKDKDGYIWGVGDNSKGQLCLPINPINGMIETFTRIDALRHANTISVGFHHLVALIGNSLYGCGSNYVHEFSDAATGYYESPLLIKQNVYAATATSRGTLVVYDGNISAIGQPASDAHSELGVPGYKSKWTDVPQDYLVRYVIGFGTYSFAFEEYASTKKGMNGWAIFGIVAAVLVVLAGAGVAVWWFCIKNRKENPKFKKYSTLNANLAAEAENW